MSNHGPPPPDVTPESAAAGYELRDVNVKVLYIVSVVVIIFVFASAIWLDDYFHIYQNKVTQEYVGNAPTPELTALHSHEAELLNNYGVVDAQKGVYRIPVDDALKQVSAASFKAQ